MTQPPLVLASSSPRRRELLHGLGLRFEIVVPDVPELVLPGESPEAHVRRLAVAKSEAALALLRARPHPAVVLAADTTVAIDGAILGKPADSSEALVMLARLAGRTHEVWTACRLTRGDDGRCATRAACSRVRFAPWDAVLARWYVATGEPVDKAGAYAIQGKGAILTAGIDGSWSNVVGLPLEELPELFRLVGDDLPRRLVEGAQRGC